MEPWTLLESQTVIKNRWLEVANNRYRSADREIDDYFVIRRSEFVLVVAVDPADNVLLVRQYRPATERFYLALPAGYIGSGESPEDAARRELAEETGVVGHDWRPIGALDPLPGYLESRAHVYRCDVPPLGSVCGGAREQPADPDESVEVCVFSRAEVRRMIMAGAVTEMQAVAAFLLADAVDASAG